MSESYPGPLQALALTLAAWLAVGLVFLSLGETLGEPLALGLGLVLGLGGIGTFAARAVPPPQAERLGLRGFAPRLLLPLLLLLPTAFLVSELDNLVRVVVPAPDAAEISKRVAERLPAGNPLDALQTLVLAGGLAAVLEEFFYRGVVQQGLVGRWGTARGVLATAVLFGFCHGGPGLSVGSWVTAAIAASCLGVVLGALRQASGSILAPILFHAGHNALAVAILGLGQTRVLPGLSAESGHVPPALLAASAASVALGAWLLRRLARR